MRATYTVPTTIDDKGTPGELLYYKNIRLPLDARVYGIPGVSVVESVITDTTIQVKKFSNINKLSSAIIMVDTLIDIDNISGGTIRSMYFFPAQSAGTCGDDINVTIRFVYTDDALDELLRVAGSSFSGAFSNAQITSLFCFPDYLLDELKLDKKQRPLLKASGGSLELLPYI